MQIVVGGSEVLLIEPGSVAGEGAAAKLGDTCVRNASDRKTISSSGLAARIHPAVDDEQIRGQFAGLGFARFAQGDPRIADIGAIEPVVEAGRDLDHLPAVGAVEACVGGQQALQQRGSAAHHPDDDDRRGDLLVEDLGVAADPLLGAQPHAQAVDDAGPQDVRADDVEIRRAA